MRPGVIILLCLALFHFSCTKENSLLCGGAAPEKELRWLSNKINEYSSSPECIQVSRTVYNGMTVFLFMSCEPTSSNVPLLYDCNGLRLNLTAENYKELIFTGTLQPIWRSR